MAWHGMAWHCRSTTLAAPGASAAASINTTTLGTTPNQQFVLQFTNVPYSGCVGSGGSVTVQVVLFESPAGRIDVHYQNVGVPCSSRSATVGLQASSASYYLIERSARSISTSSVGRSITFHRVQPCDSNPW